MTPVVLGQVHITVKDVEQSVAFYRDVVGLPFLFDVPAQRMAFLDLGGGARLYLAEAESEDERFRSRPLLYYTVPDLDAAWATATAAGAPGVSPPHVVHRGAGTELWVAFVQDPDAVVVGLMAERPRRPHPLLIEEFDGIKESGVIKESAGTQDPRIP